MYYLKTENSFDSAHFLAGYEGKCRNIHGHEWRVVIEICRPDLDEKGQTRDMMFDFGQLKKDVKREVDAMDHALIIEKGSLMPATMAALQAENFRIIELDFRPTAENMAKYFYEKIKELGYSMKSVTVYETPANSAAYME